VFDRFGETVSVKHVTAMLSLSRSRRLVGLAIPEDIFEVIEATKKQSAKGSTSPTGTLKGASSSVFIVRAAATQFHFEGCETSR